MRFSAPVRTLMAATALATTLLVASGCAGTKAGSGHLVIVGGALKDENALLYNTTIALGSPQRTAGILPTASGVPAESGPDNASSFIKYGASTTIINVTKDNPEAAQDPAVAKQIADQTIIFFTGGDQSRITRAFLPEGKPTAGYEALQGVLARGGVISGSSAGAAMMSDPMLMGGTSVSGLQFGVYTPKSQAEIEDEATDEKGIMVGQGMGFFPYGLTDQHFSRRGRLGRLIVALEHSNELRGYGVEENRAIHADLRRHTITGVGARAAVVADLSDYTRTANERTNIRLALLSNGDIMDARNGRVTPEKGKEELFAEPASADTIPTAENAWGEYVIPELINKLATTNAVEARALDPNFEIILTEDKHTRYYTAASKNLDTLTAVNVRMDILPRAR